MTVNWSLSLARVTSSSTGELLDCTGHRRDFGFTAYTWDVGIQWISPDLLQFFSMKPVSLLSFLDFGCLVDTASLGWFSPVGVPALAASFA